MKTFPVAEAKTHFSALLKDVERGEEIAISYGRKKEMVALLIPFAARQKKKTRGLGSLAGKVKVKFAKDWYMTDAELLNMK
jgi:antitoxin (DNA-binding transcriptional repressor) of toxin-antitoxin stability system